MKQTWVQIYKYIFMNTNICTNMNINIIIFIFFSLQITYSYSYSPAFCEAFSYSFSYSFDFIRCIYSYSYDARQWRILSLSSIQHPNKVHMSPKQRQRSSPVMIQSSLHHHPPHTAAWPIITANAINVSSMAFIKLCCPDVVIPQCHKRLRMICNNGHREPYCTTEMM